jgi:hypothetical protein
MPSRQHQHHFHFLHLPFSSSARLEGLAETGAWVRACRHDARLGEREVVLVSMEQFAASDEPLVGIVVTQDLLHAVLDGSYGVGGAHRVQHAHRRTSDRPYG